MGGLWGIWEGVWGWSKALGSAGMGRRGTGLAETGPVVDPVADMEKNWEVVGGSGEFGVSGKGWECGRTAASRKQLLLLLRVYGREVQWAGTMHGSWRTWRYE